MRNINPIFPSSNTRGAGQAPEREASRTGPKRDDAPAEAGASQRTVENG
jgi:hypothetical protein